MEDAAGVPKGMGCGPPAPRQHLPSQPVQLAALLLSRAAHLCTVAARCGRLKRCGSSSGWQGGAA
jgi:hypothetical protein